MGMLGLLIGSFLNVVAYRVPAGESVVYPGSRCPACGHAIRNRHNIPVLSWVVLRGRCYDCEAAISTRYPLVEAVTAALFVAIALRFVNDQRLWPAYLYLVAVGVVLSLIDLDQRRLPDAIVLPSYLILGLLFLIDGSPHALVRALDGAAGLLLFYGVIAAAAKGAMGLGDIKLAALLGGATAYVSWGTFLVGSFLAFALGAGFGLLLMAAGRAGRKTAIPFGPFMISGALIAVLGVGQLGDSYLSGLGLR